MFIILKILKLKNLKNIKNLASLICAPDMEAATLAATLAAFGGSRLLRKKRVTVSSVVRYVILKYDWLV